MIIFVDKAVYAYNMHFSYIVLIALCFHTLNLFYNKKKIDIIFVLLDIVLILAFGSRGPMLCYVLFIMMFVFFGKQRRAIKVLVGVFASLISIYFSRIMSKIEELMQLLNIHSRTISLLVTNPQYVSGRDVITQNTFSLISQSPIVGYGLAGEYKYLKEYPHNLILDVVVNWGIIIGGLFLCALFYIVIMGLLCSKDKIRLLLIVFVAYGLVALLFSGTYISWDGFYILIGLSLGTIRNKREGA